MSCCISKQDGTHAVVALDAVKVSKLCGLQLMSKHKSVPVTVPDLVEGWKAKLPETIPVDVKLLEVQLMG